MILFRENEEQLDKVYEAWHLMPALEKIVVFDRDGLREGKGTEFEFSSSS
jgi:hypothetical protein